MYPSRFDYLAPTSLEEVVAALGEREGAKVMAGGQSLIPVLKLRIASVDTVVDLNGVPGLDGIEQGGELRIGALVRHADAERSSTPGGALRGAREHGAARHRPARPQPRHRLARWRTQTHRGTGARRCSPHGRASWRAADRGADDPGGRAVTGPFSTTLGRTRSSRRCACPTRDRAPAGRTEARAQGRRLRVGRPRGPGDARQRERRPGGIGLTGVGATNLRAAAPRTRSEATSRRRTRSSRRRGWPGKRPSRNPTTAAPRNTRVNVVPRVLRARPPAISAAQAAGKE